MAPRDEKNYGPQIVGLMLGVCIGSYIEYGVTKEELKDLVDDMYDGIVGQLKLQDLEPGFGKLTNAAIESRLARLKNLVVNNHLPEERDAALWYLLGQFERELQLIKDEM